MTLDELIQRRSEEGRLGRYSSGTHAEILTLALEIKAIKERLDALEPILISEIEP